MGKLTDTLLKIGALAVALATLASSAGGVKDAFNDLKRKK